LLLKYHHAPPETKSITIAMEIKTLDDKKVSIFFIICLPFYNFII
jgi:hypothetical protein